MWSYAGAAHVRFDPEMAVLGGAFTRLYDDLMEDREHIRFDVLFHGRGFNPGSELEALLASLYRTIDEKLGRSRDDPLFEIARRVHAWQIASTRQRSPEISNADVREITLGKGGWGVAALCALLRPAMSSADQDAAVRLGGLLQVFDDHYDRELDAADGIATTATRRLYTIRDLTSEAGAVRRELRAHFGPGRERRSSAMIFAMLVIVPILRMREAVGGGSRRHQMLNSSNSRRHFLRRTSPLDVRDR
ncbi:hypothetical protein [Catenulispora rubra]|uniref:hypothetical protein n=1 Tax=Catenulispora rubra TaxID=280293 RepID=UPI0018927D88|nr:hypothetical protein [Catenulispora rubra]